MSNSLKVSVVMSVYNEPKDWLKSAIESILKQTFKDFEFIIIIDNPINTVNIEALSSYATQDTRVKLIFNEQNIGLTKSLNKGLQYATGKYIARMDADDISIPERLQKQFDFLEKNPDYVACGSTILYINEDKMSNELLKKPLTDYDIKTSLFYESPIMHPTLFFRNGLDISYDPYFVLSQDYDIITKLATKGKMHNFALPLLYYRRSSQQITSKKLSQQNNFARIIRMRNICNYFEQKSESVDVLSNNINGIDRLVFSNLLSLNKERRVNSYMFYSLFMYYKPKSIKRSVYIAGFQPFLRLSLKYRVRLLLSVLITFNDQK